jgi:hypothetical protein
MVAQGLVVAEGHQEQQALPQHRVTAAIMVELLGLLVQLVVMSMGLGQVLSA